MSFPLRSNISPFISAVTPVDLEYLVCFKVFPVLTVTGNILGTVLKGDEECGSVDAELRVAVAEFNSALANFASRIGFRTFEVSTLTLDVSLHGLEMGMRNLEVGKQI